MAPGGLRERSPQWIKDVTRPLREALRRTQRKTLYACVTWRPTRAVLNVVVNARIPGVSATLLDRITIACWGRRQNRTGAWRIRLVDRTVTVPTGEDLTLLDALGVLQHDAAIKRFYLQTLRDTPPDLFLDVGANTGRDSFVFLASGVPTISFEPNAACHPTIRSFARAAGAEARIEHVAISDHDGETVLVVPAGRSFLGSIDPEVATHLRTLGRTVEAMPVPMAPLDRWLPECVGRRVLLKIDTEGHELAVLAGAAAILREVRPAVVFEAWPGPHRADLFTLLAGAGYSVRVADTAPRPELDEAEFRSARPTNFLALPRGSERSWGFA